MGPGKSPSVIDTTRETLLSFAGVVLHYDPPASSVAIGTFAPPVDGDLDPQLAARLRNEYPEGLYRHQALALSHVLKRENTVVATQTSSGKSLIYYVPVFDSLLKNENSTALFIYPQKALAGDQLKELARFAAKLPSLSGKVDALPYLISRYDGAIADELRPSVRSQVQILLTNPDMVHVAILQHHENHWSRFFSNLQYVIIDECHEYRGIFGTNVAYLLRRLRQICQLNGVAPSFIATSATIRKPQEHLEKLTGVPFVAIGPETDGSVQGKKKFWMVSGSEHFYDFGRKVALGLARRGLSVLAFCPSRLAAERMMAKVLSSKDDKLPFVRVYRAGLSAQQRGEIEEGLRDKSVRLVFSTSALELGIDIGALDAVVCVGVPSSMMSLWQRAGRVARAGREGAIILVPADTPIDSYYAAHPDELFSKENEPLALNLHNRRVVYCHYACAVNEVGGVDDRLRLGVLGEAMQTIYELRAKGDLNDDIFYRSDPHMSVNLRSMGEGPYTLQCAGGKIGEIDEFHLLREAYRNARTCPIRS
jgi:DEAD/DEAH box helicase domain-containing protein